LDTANIIDLYYHYFTKCFLCGHRSISRLRTVSTTSEHDTMDDSAAECSASSTCKVLLNLRSYAKKDRAKSETNDYYQVASSPESPNTDLVPSLACEEVFDDESSCVSVSEMNGTSNSAVR
uniref:Nucleolar autoantigen 36 n=1 Tax=Gongylonema pulchrum TaxID=637853 RepID=A0A183D8V5_9BILA